MRLELNLTERLFASRLGIRTILFRPPYSIDQEPDTADQVRPLEVTQDMGYVTIGNRIDPNDWRENPHRSAEQITAAVMKDLPPCNVNDQLCGNIILLHDGGGDRRETVRALPMIIEGLRSRGYEIVPVYQLLGKTKADVMPPLRSNERWATDLTQVYCVRRLGPSRRRDRLPRPGAHRPRVRPARAGEGGRAGARGGLSGTVRHPAPWRSYADRPLRQRPDLSESTLSRGVSRLPAYAGVHHTVYAPAEWNHRALLPQLEGGMRLAAQLRQLRTRPARAECVDPLVQRGAPAPGAGLSEPARLPGARSRSGGLILGEHYSTPCPIREGRALFAFLEALLANAPVPLRPPAAPAHDAGLRIHSGERSLGVW